MCTRGHAKNIARKAGNLNLTNNLQSISRPFTIDCFWRRASIINMGCYKIDIINIRSIYFLHWYAQRPSVVLFFLFCQVKYDIFVFRSTTCVVRWWKCVFLTVSYIYTRLRQLNRICFPFKKLITEINYLILKGKGNYVATVYMY